MWVKVCGLKTIDDALLCAEAGADAVGFVFAPGRRTVSEREAEKIIAALPQGVEKVGVFVDRPVKEVEAVVRGLGLDLVQLHGRESPADCAALPVPAVKAFKIGSPEDLEAVRAYRRAIRACLLDTLKPGCPGGTGITWDWRYLHTVHGKSLEEVPVIVAGGLNADNLARVLTTVKPYGLDVSSGVEKAGQKDRGLVEAFLKTVRRWENEQST